MHHDHYTFFLLDVCDPSWRITRDGLFISGFVASIVSFILAALVVWIHVYSNYDESEELHTYIQLYFTWPTLSCL